MYSNPYYNPAQWMNEPDDNQLGRVPYQYGTATRSQAGLDFPAAAAFNAVPPFDFLRISDGGGYWTFTFRPDVAPAPAIVIGRNVQINILGATDTQVAQFFNDAVGLISIVDSPDNPKATFKIASRRHALPTNRVTLTQIQIGMGIVIDTTGMTVAGFLSVVPTTSTNGMSVGKTFATGWIVSAVAGAGLVDTETFTIVAPDTSVVGGLVTRVFEFDSGAGVTPGNVAVPFTALDTAAQVAASIIATINNPAAPPAGRGPNFGMIAKLVGTFLVNLRATIPGSIGGSVFSPNLIQETVANAAFFAIGMTGGQDGSIMVPIRWGLSRGAIPQIAGFDIEGGEG